MPTLLALGGRSALARIVGAGLRAGPTMRVETLPGAGHFLPEEAPDAVRALVARR